MALCFESDDARRGKSTIAIDAAAAVGVRNYDWSGKIRAQLIRGELPAVAAMLPGYLHRYEYRNHGPDKSKGFSFENQGAGFSRVWGKTGALAVPMEAPDIYAATALFLRQLRKEHIWFDGAALELLLRRLAARMGFGRARRTQSPIADRRAASGRD